MNIFDRMINLGWGTFSLTKEKIEKTIDEMVERGEMNREEAKRTMEDLIQRGEEQRDQLRVMVREEMDKWSPDYSAAKTQLEDLEARIKELEEKLNQASQG